MWWSLLISVAHVTTGAHLNHVLKYKGWASTGSHWPRESSPLPLESWPWPLILPLIGGPHVHLGKLAPCLIMGMGELGLPLIWGVVVPAAQINQVSYHPGAHLGLWVGTPQYLPQLWPARVHEGLALLHSHRISMTRGNSRRSERRFSEGPALMVYQKLEALNQTNNSLHNEHFQVKLFGQKAWYTAAPSVTETNKEAIERQGKWRRGGLLFV